MSVLDLFRNEYVNGKVVDKYRLKNGNLGFIVEDAATRRRYHVEFRDGYLPQRHRHQGVRFSAGPQTPVDAATLL